MNSPLAKSGGSIGCAILALPMLAAAVIAVLLGGLSPTKHARMDIPAHLLALYQRAAPECPGLHWTVLAAIGKVETDHSRHPTMISSAGAVGPMQFLPSTFRMYAYPVPPGGKKPPTPWDPVDAVYAAARLLCANGAKNGQNLRRAIRHYNHSDSYVNRVLATADGYESAAPTSNKPAARAVAFARAHLGATYVWGGDGPAEGGFDCSGLTKAAYASAGITLPRVAQDQFRHGPRVPRDAPLLPGDLLFFGTSAEHITHVALYTGSGRAIDAPRPGAVVREGPADTDSSSFQGATRPAARKGRK